MKKVQQGFGIIEAISLLALIGLIVCIGFFAYTRRATQRKVDNLSTTPIAQIEPGAGDTQPNRKYRLGCSAQEIQVIINFKPGVTEREAKATIASAGDTYLSKGGSAIDPSYIARSHIKDDGSDVDAIVQEVVNPYKVLPKVDFAEVNGCGRTN